VALERVQIFSWFDGPLLQVMLTVAPSLSHRSCRSFRHLSVDDELLHMAFHSPRGGEEKAKDFVLLVSKRAPQELVR